MKIFLIVIGCVVIGFIGFSFLFRKAYNPVGEPCSVCGIKSDYGYSKHAEEDADKLKPMCLNHLIAKIGNEYETFQGRAVVIEPADGLPCYVFQPAEEWHQAFNDSKIYDDVVHLLKNMDTKCHDCRQKANFLWVESKGLTGDNFDDTLDKGLSSTLLSHNPAPVSLCPKCCVSRIRKVFQVKHLSYIEVCAPKGNVDGFVIPMGY